MNRLHPHLAIFTAVFLAVALAHAANPALEEARKALDDGLPSVALFRLQQVSTSMTSPEDKLAANLLMARALNASGRYAETAALLNDGAESGAEAQMLLARAFIALDRKNEALALYRKLAADPRFAEEAIVGQAVVLQALGRSDEADGVLTKFVGGNPSSVSAVLALAGIRLSTQNYHGAVDVLTHLTRPTTDQASTYDYLLATAWLGQGETEKADRILQSIKDPPATLAANVAIARAQYLEKTKDPSGAEKVLESFIDENYRLPGLEAVFAELDHVYSSQGAASGTELKRWANGNDDPRRANLAAFYLARNEARNSKVDRSRQLYEDFLQKNPGHFLANAARTGLASSYMATGDIPSTLKSLQDAPKDGEAGFLRGLAQAAQEHYADAAQSFTLAANTSSLRPSALFNAAICGALAGVSDKDNEALREVAANDPSGEKVQRIHFAEALFFAAEDKPEAAELLKNLAASDTPIGQKARLALAEWDFSTLEFSGARDELRRVSTTDPADRERAEYLSVFLADTGDAQAGTQAAALAEAFLKNHPDSQFVPDVRMKWAEILFRRGDYLGAGTQFAAVAEDSPTSPLAENARFLCAQAMSRSMDLPTMEKAVQMYEDVAKGGGALVFRARLEEARLFNALHRPKEALGIFDSILESQADPEMRYMTLIEKGDTLNSLGTENPDNYKKAIAAWQAIASDAEASSPWKNQALTKMGAAYEELGDSTAALNCYYSVFSQGQKGEPEYFWFYKAGFDAGRLLETQKLWNEAIAVYEKIGSFDGPRSEEARNKVNTLRLENFIWEN